MRLNRGFAIARLSAPEVLDNLSPTGSFAVHKQVNPESPGGQKHNPDDGEYQQRYTDTSSQVAMSLTPSLSMAAIGAVTGKMVSTTQMGLLGNMNSRDENQRGTKARSV